MSGFKRLCMFLYGLIGLFSISVLTLTWVGPWTAQARSLLERNEFLIALEVCVLITAIGFVGFVLVALFYPRNHKETVVASVEGGNITVTRHAIVSQTRNVIEQEGVCKATSIKVSCGKRGNVRVSVRVKPHYPIDVIEYGEHLYAELNQGLSQVCGDSVKSIDVVFTEPARSTKVEEQAPEQDEPTADATQAPADSGQGISVRPNLFSGMFSRRKDKDGQDGAGQEAEPEAEPGQAADAASDAAGDAAEPAGAADASEDVTIPLRRDAEEVTTDVQADATETVVDAEPEVEA